MSGSECDPWTLSGGMGELWRKRQLGARWIETSGESAADHNASSSPNRQQEDRCTHARTDRLFSRHTSHELVR